MQYHTVPLLVWHMYFNKTWHDKTSLMGTNPFCSLVNKSWLIAIGIYLF